MAIYTDDDDAAVNNLSSFKAAPWLLTLSKVKNIAEAALIKHTSQTPN